MRRHSNLSGNDLLRKQVDYRNTCSKISGIMGFKYMVTGYWAVY